MIHKIIRARYVKSYKIFELRYNQEVCAEIPLFEKQYAFLYR